VTIQSTSLDLSALSDGELGALSIAGRDSAFAEIVRRHRTILYRIDRSTHRRMSAA